MTRFSVLSAIAKSSHILSLKLANFSNSAFRFCTSFGRFVLYKTLELLSPMDLFTSSWDTNFLDEDFSQPSTSFFRSYDPPDEDDYNNEKLYLVPFSWWKEAQCSADPIEGVLFTGFSNNDDDDEAVLNLRKEDVSTRFTGGNDGLSGLECAFIPEAVWLRGLKWFNDSKAAVDSANLFVSEDFSWDVFPIQIRISLSLETNSLTVRIQSKDNMVENYRRVCKIFSSKFEKLHIWDFSGQTTNLFVNQKLNFPNDSSVQSSEQVLQLQVYGFSDAIHDAREGYDTRVQHSNAASSFQTRSVHMNGETDSIKPHPILSNSLQRGIKEAVFLGLNGLQNLGNTCFMNSAIQCLAHTPELVDYFLGNYQKDLNCQNPLGMKGELALATGYLFRKLWTPGEPAVAPRIFKSKLADFAPQFSGYNQHDSQEFLAFLLDGLHEDLNRVKNKPYIEVKEAYGRPDEEVAEEYWQNYLARNDSSIIDIYLGQYRSKLVCPVCLKVSVTFDPFMYLSLPLPSTTMRTMSLTVFSSEGISLPVTVTVTVPKYGMLKDLIEAISSACSLRDDETLLVAEIYRNKICRFLEEPSDSIALIRDGDKLVAYRLLKDDEAHLLVVFNHERWLERSYDFETSPEKRSLFGIPLVTRLSSICQGFDLRKEFMILLNPFLMPSDMILSDYDDLKTTGNEDSQMNDVTSPRVSDDSASSGDEKYKDPRLSSDFRFYVKEDKYDMHRLELKMEDPILVSGSMKLLDVYVFWPQKMLDNYDTYHLTYLPEVFKTQFYLSQPPDSSTALYKCLEAYLKEEPLGMEDMWYCPSCKEPRQAIKKLDMWRLPNILVIHLKRFSYSRLVKSKLETYVDFPVDDLDLTPYISHRTSEKSNRYMLYAISNHYGGMGGGHYTAFVKLGHGSWYEFDDDRVLPVSEDTIKTSAAYVLFYRRVTG